MDIVVDTVMARVADTTITIIITAKGRFVTR